MATMPHMKDHLSFKTPERDIYAVMTIASMCLAVFENQASPATIAWWIM